MNEFTRYALLKGLIFSITVYGSKKIYEKAKNAYLI